MASSLLDPGVKTMMFCLVGSIVLTAGISVVMVSQILALDPSEVEVSDTDLPDIYFHHLANGDQEAAELVYEQVRESNFNEQRGELVAAFLVVLIFGTFSTILARIALDFPR